MEKKYDYIVVGAGIAGAMFARKAVAEGKSCLVIDKNNFIGGFCYTERIDGIDVHKFGAHIFRTNRRDVWNFVNSITPFSHFVNSPIARYYDEVYNLPFNMNTFHQLFGVTTPREAQEALERDRIKCCNPTNLEEHVLSIVGKTIYKKLVKGYTEKQWGKPCNQLPPSIMRRIPLRMTYNNNYYNEKYQGIPEAGYTDFIEKLLDGCDVELGVDYFDRKDFFDNKARHIVYTGRLDEFFGYRYGCLDYQRVRFVHSRYDIPNYQGNAVVNYTDAHIPYTRSIEHKHFTGVDTPGTIVTYEFPHCPECNLDGALPSYPLNDRRNNELAQRYKDEADRIAGRFTFLGRLAEYKYYSMNDIVEKFV